jgi:hypothetical protein
MVLTLTLNKIIFIAILYEPILLALLILIEFIYYSSLILSMKPHSMSKN